ncbi:MAG TPA: PH domain-containing protein [Solirubrobacteraceae bacterium]|nr:PH domain-containing protein [Solirubrobacteraceae bacterium]
MTEEPTRRLAPRARLVWRMSQGLGWGVAVVAGLIAGAQLDGALAVLVRVLPVVGLVAGVTLVPELRWRRWRWDVRPEAIDIRHGTLTVRRTLVPMLRVQHVDTTRDIVEQSLDLATVVVHTAAGSHRIPLLTVADAAEVRDRIADLARTADEP